MIAAPVSRLSHTKAGQDGFMTQGYALARLGQITSMDQEEVVTCGSVYLLDYQYIPMVSYRSWRNRKKVCGLPPWSSVLITPPHSCRCPLTAIRPRAQPDAKRSISESKVWSCLWQRETPETINQVDLMVLTPGVEEHLTQLRPTMTRSKSGGHLSLLTSRG